MIETDALERSYGSVRALEPLTLRIEPGRIVGLLGANGAGKTTLLSILATLLEPTAGTARVAGHDVVREPLEVRRRLGYVPEHASVYEGLTAEEHLELSARIRDLPPATARERTETLLGRLDLIDARSRRLGTFSKGMRGKVVLAAALLHEPEVLLLDEPLSGLDPPTQAVALRLLRDHATAGRVVVYSSHVVEQVESTCDELVVLGAGRLAFRGTVDELRATRPDATLATIVVDLVARPR